MPKLNFIFCHVSYNNKRVMKQTPICDIIGKVEGEFVKFLNDSRRSGKYVLTMFDKNVSRTLGDTCAERCWWCHHTFDTRPVGCPVRYIPSQTTKKVQAYEISENLNSFEEVMHSHNMTRESYFETDGIFCSYECCLAYIYDNKHNPVYAQSKHLLRMMRIVETGDVNSGDISSAPSWRMLREYGGTLSIENFRRSFANAEYNEVCTVRSIPICVMYDEKKYF